jgi:phosphoribosyl 1,2-cyclic phosphodiesterase
VNVTFWGTRGSLAAPGPDTVRYGGNTSCVEVRSGEHLLVLDAGTGIRRLGQAISRAQQRIDILLTHLHMDHIQGLGFFAPLRRAETEVHIWGPASATMALAARLSRYLSPPLFPVRVRDLECGLVFHELTALCEIGPFRIRARHVCHPGSTVGYRIETDDGVLAYLPDHEPALGSRPFPREPEWTSGYDVADGADVLIHDAQYTRDEYPQRVGWGHSSLDDMLSFARLAAVRRLVPFHYDPGRSDDALEAALGDAVRAAAPTFPVTPAREGQTLGLR